MHFYTAVLVLEVLDNSRLVFVLFYFSKELPLPRFLLLFVSKTTGQQGFGAQPLPSVTSRIVTSEQRTSISSSVVALCETKINTLKHGHHHIVKQFSLSPPTATASANI